MLPFVWAAASRLGIVQTPCRKQKTRVLLVLEGESNKHLRLAFLHACMISVHKLRGPHALVAVSRFDSYIRNNFRDVVIRSPNLKASFLELRRRGGGTGAIVM